MENSDQFETHQDPVDTVRSTVPIHSIIPNPRNPNLHPEEQLERLTASILRYGQAEPLLVRTANKMLISGHGVWEAMKRAGRENVVVDLWDVSQQIADEYMVAANRLAKLSNIDTAALGSLLSDVDPGDLLAMGFDEEEAASVIEGHDTELGDIIDIETTEVYDEYWITVRGLLKDQAAVIRAISIALEPFPEAEVEHGTTDLDG